MLPDRSQIAISKKGKSATRVRTRQTVVRQPFWFRRLHWSNDAVGNRNRKQSRGSQILSTLTQLLTQTMRLSPAAPEGDAETVTMPKGTSITEIEEIDLAPADNGDFLTAPGGKSTRNVSPVRRHHWDDEDA